MNEYIFSDCYRYYGKSSRLLVLKGFFINRLFRFQVALRLASSENFFERILGKLLYKFNMTKKGCSNQSRDEDWIRFENRPFGPDNN